VTDKDGSKRGQELLDTLISKIAIDLPKFHNASAAEKAKILLQTLGIEEELAKLDADEKAKCDTRTIVGREADQKAKAAADMPWYEDMPEKKLSVAELISKQQEVLTRNGERAKARASLENNKNLLNHLNREIERLEKELAETHKRFDETNFLIANAKEISPDEDTSELQRQIEDYESINEKINANAERSRREHEADVLQDQYDALTCEIEDIRKRRLDLLANAEFPISGLAVQDGELMYDGKSWDCMSGSQQLIVDCAIASKLNPNCSFVLLDKLEQLDLDTLTEFGKWLEEQDLQCIATRVSTGDECTLIIEDGEAAEEAKTTIVPTPTLPDEY
jgi:hypothetical protein